MTDTSTPIYIYILTFVVHERKDFLHISKATIILSGVIFGCRIRKGGKERKHEQHAWIDDRGTMITPYTLGCGDAVVVVEEEEEEGVNSNTLCLLVVVLEKDEEEVVVEEEDRDHT